MTNYKLGERTGGVICRICIRLIDHVTLYYSRQLCVCVCVCVYERMCACAHVRMCVCAYVRTCVTDQKLLCFCPGQKHNFRNNVGSHQDHNTIPCKITHSIILITLQNWCHLKFPRNNPANFSYFTEPVHSPRSIS